CDAERRCARPARPATFATAARLNARERLASRHGRSLPWLAFASDSSANPSRTITPDDGLGLVPVKAPRCARPTLTRGCGLDGILDRGRSGDCVMVRRLHGRPE